MRALGCYLPSNTSRIALTRTRPIKALARYRTRTDRRALSSAFRFPTHKHSTHSMANARRDGDYPDQRPPGSPAASEVRSFFSYLSSICTLTARLWAEYATRGLCTGRGCLSLLVTPRSLPADAMAARTTSAQGQYQSDMKTWKTLLGLLLPACCNLLAWVLVPGHMYIGLSSTSRGE